MRIFRGRTFADVYNQIVETILYDGEISETRFAHPIEDNSPTHELTLNLRNVMFEVANPIECRLTTPYKECRKVSSKVGYIEGLMLHSSSNEVKYVPWYKGFTRDGEHSYSMYGQYIQPMLSNIITKLRNNPLTRQCVFTIYENKNNIWYKDETDVPCTLLGVFDIINDKLYLTMVMRSNDVYLGTPYNIQMFSFLQQTVANTLGLKLGSYTHIVHNMHIYYSNIPELKKSISLSKFYSKSMKIDFKVVDAIKEANKYMRYVDENSVWKTYPTN